jgi:hypothetical protein
VVEGGDQPLVVSSNLAHDAGTLRVVDRKAMTAEEFEQLSPAEQDRVFAASIVTNLADVPPEFLAKVRARVEARLSASDAFRKS